MYCRQLLQIIAPFYIFIEIYRLTLCYELSSAKILLSMSIIKSSLTHASSPNKFSRHRRRINDPYGQNADIKQVNEFVMLQDDHLPTR